MKKIIYSFTLAAFLFSGCAKEVETPQTEGEFKTVTIEAEIPQVKAAVSDQGKSSWQVGDVIGIHTVKGAIAEFTYLENKTFKGQIAVDDELAEMAIYPFNIATSYNADKGLFKRGL